MKIYNTLTRQKEKFVTIEKNKVKIYACGPTVYNLIHIGNARPICVFDVLRRYLLYKGFDVTFVQNFTDVDDKIIKKANEENVKAKDISERYIKEYEIDAQGLNVLKADIHPKVTQTMPQIIAFINALVDEGYAYASNGDVYFRTKKFKEYGKLSHMPLDELEAGARIELNKTKENPMDFALWKKAKDDEPSWESPFGKGRPGWHIECSAMIKHFLGNTIDIHCGGQDLIFPHHENEIAQSECCNKTTFANFWMHNGYINVDNKKMSKSLNNFFTTREIAQKYGYEPIRLLMLQAHYRTPINFTVEIIEQCVASLNRIYTCNENLTIAKENSNNIAMSKENKSKIDNYKERFIVAMDDDLNTADAISVIFELVKEININLSLEKMTSREYIEYSQKLLNELVGILGLLYERTNDEIPQNIYDLVEKRMTARRDKNFELADKIRDEIIDLGYVVEETRQGIKVYKR